ncbi:DUF4129 domain-containing protein [Natronobacterium texcoconense]|uniref:DUF4129 domain-containing protein n=1 Tax=Natronobacterium texcoconense TaxID=1095778 RepID=A0A1H1FGF1_NATTX|nr:DUF4129 domain-containing protein [Natronobacterium texcoconense]SDQ99809.1 hypothetical protein SAMN04489842_1952 [Natronobacterium texcoconense]
MRFERTVVAGSALLAAVALGLSATALETASISSSPAPGLEGEHGDGSGLSLLAALMVVLDAVLGVFGIDLEPATPASAPGSALEVFVAVVNAAYLVALLGLVVLLVVAAGVFSRRRLQSLTLMSANAVVNPRWWVREPTGSETASDPWPPETAPDDVGREWLEMIEGIDASRPRSRTPAEWATAAVDDGYNESYVETVTRRFRETRYGPDRQESPSRNRAETDADESRED